MNTDNYSLYSSLYSLLVLTPANRAEVAGEVAGVYFGECRFAVVYYARLGGGMLYSWKHCFTFPGGSIS